MNNEKQPIQTVTTIGKLAKVYGVEPKTLMAMIEPFEELKNELHNYLKLSKNKGQKVLPPVITLKILLVLGEP